MYVKRILKDQNEIRMKLGNDVSFSRKLRKLGLIGTTTGPAQCQSLAGLTLAALAHSSPKKEKPYQSNSLEKEIQLESASVEDTDSSHENLVAKSRPASKIPVQTSNSRQAAVVLQDGMKVLLDHIGDTSQAARIRCCVEPDRELVEEIMLRPEHRQPVAKLSLGALVTVRNNDANPSKPSSFTANSPLPRNYDLQDFLAF